MRAGLGFLILYVTTSVRLQAVVSEAARSLFVFESYFVPKWIENHLAGVIMTKPVDLTL